MSLDMTRAQFDPQLAAANAVLWLTFPLKLTALKGPAFLPRNRP